MKSLSFAATTFCLYGLLSFYITPTMIFEVVQAEKVPSLPILSFMTCSQANFMSIGVVTYVLASKMGNGNLVLVLLG